MGKSKMTRRKLCLFFNYRVSVTLVDGRVLVGILMAVDKHQNLVLCNCEEYRRYRVKGQPEGKELKRMLGFIVIRGDSIMYVHPEEAGKEELVEPIKPKKIKAKAAPAEKQAAPKAAMPNLPGLPSLPNFPPRPAMPGMLGGLPGMPGLRPMGGLPGMPGGSFPPGLLAGLGGGLPGMPGMIGAGRGMPGMPRM